MNKDREILGKETDGKEDNPKKGDRFSNNKGNEGTKEKDGKKKTKMKKGQKAWKQKIRQDNNVSEINDVLSEIKNTIFIIKR